MRQETERETGTFGRLLRHGLGFCGVLAALALIAVSAAMNWRFGYSLGRSEVDGLIYGTASAAADCLKALVPFYFFSALRHRMWSQAAAAAVVGIVVTGYSLASAFGHAAQNRSDTTGQRAIEVAAYKRLEADLKTAREQLSWVPPHRPAAMVRSELESLKVQRQWTLTEACRSVAGRAAREYCGTYHALAAELGSGEEAAGLAARIREIQDKLDRIEGGTAGGDADPQAALIGRMLGVEVERVQLALTIFVAILLEVGSGMGLYVACSQWRVEAPGGRRETPMKDITPPPSDAPAAAALPKPDAATADVDRSLAADANVRRFCDDRVRQEVGRSYPVTSLYEAYRSWCDDAQVTTLALPAFVRAMDELGIERRTTKAGVACVGIGLEDGAARGRSH